MAPRLASFLQTSLVRFGLATAVLALGVRLGAAEPAPITTASGLKVVITKAGTGPSPQPGQVVIAHYVGTFTDGKVFDSSRARNEPFAFTLSRPEGGGKPAIKRQVIVGWDEGFRLLHVGDQATFTIPPSIAYGDKPRGPIPANSTLIFAVELLDLKDQALADTLRFRIDSYGLASGIWCYNLLRKSGFQGYYVSESQLNALGYSYLGKGKVEEAHAVLSWNAQLHPNSGNAFDSLGEADAKAGHRALALLHYRRSLELAPDNENAKKMIAELEAAQKAPAPAVH